VQSNTLLLDGKVTLKAEHCSAFLLDTHCHLLEVSPHWQGGCVAGGLSVTTHPEALLTAMDSKSIMRWLTAGGRLAIGLHPWYADQSVDWQIVEQTLFEHPLLAVGEIGLDGLPHKPEWSLQKQVFRQQLQLARRYDRVVSVHLVRDRGEGVVLLKASGVQRVIIHGFCGGLTQAKQYQALGWVLGIGSRCVSRMAEKQKNMLLGLNRQLFVLESDAPYTCLDDQTPDAVITVATELALLWAVTPEWVIIQAYQNWQNLWSNV
jgi:Tat protein secretion system quality control protein TatD with DNase activity